MSTNKAPIDYLLWYDWQESNRHKQFATWQEEVSHVESLGYALVPPTYHIPHWATVMSMGAALPKIFVLRDAGPDELGTHFNCPAGQLGYPVYYKRKDVIQLVAEEAFVLGFMTSREGYNAEVTLDGLCDGATPPSPHTNESFREMLNSSEVFKEAQAEAVSLIQKSLPR